MKNTEIQSILAYRIRTLRDYYRLTQAQFAEKLGLKQSSISNWESTRRQIPIEVLVTICEHFDLPFSYFDPMGSGPEEKFASKQEILEATNA